MNQFKEELKGMLEERGLVVKFGESQKLNYEPFECVYVSKDGSVGATSCSLGNLYSRYCTTGDIVEIVDELEEYCCDASEKLEGVPQSIVKWECVKDSVSVRAVQVSGNEKVLEEFVCVRVEDLAFVFTLRDQFATGPNTSTVANITKKLANSWGVTEKELTEAAYQNIDRFSWKLWNIVDIIREVAPDGSSVPDELANAGGSADMHVLSYENKFHGAGLLFYPNILEECLSTLGWDGTYIIPSSVHEVLLLPMHSVYEAGDIREMVKEVNDTSVPAEDILSYSLYKFEKGDMSITMI